MKPILAIFIGLFCISCQKQAPNDKYYGHLQLDHSIYDYLYLPAGSVLVFQDSLSGAIDTLYVDECDLDTFSVTNDFGELIYHGESWYQLERHSHTGHSFSFSTKVRDPRNFTNCMVFKGSIANGVTIDIFIYGPIPVFLGSSWQLGNNRVNKIVNYYDSISFDSTVYSSVYTIHTIRELSMNYTDNLYYYAKGYGLIRWEELTTNKIWKRIL